MIQTYKGYVAFMHMKHNPFLRTNTETIADYALKVASAGNKVSSFYGKYKDTWYQMNPIKLLASVLPCLRPVANMESFGDHWKMCSDIATTFYKQIGIIAEDVVSADVVPEDFIHDSDGQVNGIFKLPPTHVLP